MTGPEKLEQQAVPPSIAPASLLAGALSLHQSGRQAEAEAAYREMLATTPDSAEAWNNLGLLLHAQGRDQEALDCLQQVTRLQTDNARGFANLGVVLRQLGRLDEARAAQERAIALQPNFASARNNLGNLLHASGDFSSALTHFEHAVRLAPDLFEHHFMLGKCRLELHDHPGALAALHRALALAPTDADCLGTIARVWNEALRLPEALAAYDAAMTIRPDYPTLRYNRALAKLLAGDLRGGFADYEARWQVADFPSKRLLTDKPVWQGQPLDGTLLLHAEQGLGDTLQCLRFLPEAARRTKEVLLLIQTPLIGLAVLPANVRLVREGEPLPPFDAVCPLFSLPFLFGTDILSIPATLPYLKTDPERITHWKSRLAGPALKIGLTWAGNPSHRNDANRSLPLSTLAPLLDLPNTAFYGLQVGPRSADIVAAGLGERITDLSGELKDFSDTAAVLENLDLLIAVDTSIVHLAGALGLPVWLLLPQVPDWRWLTDRDDSPWYPSLRLFRQPAHAQWAPVVAQLIQALSELSAPATLAAAETTTERGRACIEQGQMADAAQYFWQVLRQRPLHARALSGLAVAAWRENRPAAALAFGTRACRTDPHNPENWSNLGAYLKGCGQLEQAAECLQEALRLSPDNATALSNYGNLLGRLERWPEALDLAEQALALQPEQADFHYNLGIACKENSQFARALVHFRSARHLAGEHIKAHLHEALTLLLQGDLEAGWEAYESRWQQPDCKEHHDFTCPLWQGESIDGKTILLYSEQGFGDSFQFMRYAPLLAERGARVLLVVQPEVEALARRMPGKHEVFASGAQLPEFDFHCPLLSLPRAFGTTLATIPASVPYLRADAERLAHWQQRIGNASDKLRIGLVWAGRPTHGNDINRSLTLRHFLPLLANPRYAFFALQKGPAVGQANELPAGSTLTVLDAELRDFDDTAAVLCQLDLLITVDTSVAHLAGALGVPTLVLLPHIPDWRWLWARNDSPWYPTLSLLRQPQRGDWATVLEQLNEKLAGFRPEGGKFDG